MTTMRELVENCRNEQNSEEVEVHGLGAHAHCDTCIKVTKCTVQPSHNESCEIVSCELSCGFRFHACKLTEHKLLCANEKVACINAGNGCPVTLIRHQRARHLETCPASVVICNMEWNRWPLYSQAHQMRDPLYIVDPQSKKGQLDLALVLRDQRRLNDWIMACKARHAIPKSLIKRFPRVPFQSWPSCEGENSVFVPSITDEDEKSWECKKAPPGLQSSVCGELYRVARDNISDSTLDPVAHITSKSHSVEHNGTQEFISTGNSNTHENSVCGVEYGDRSPPGLLSGSFKNQIDHSVVENSRGTCPQTNKLIVNSAHSELPALDSIPRSDMQYFEGTNRTSDTLSHSFDMIESTCDEQNERFRVCIINNTQRSEKISDSVADDIWSITPSSTSHSPSTIVSLGLDLTLETITRYQSKPNDMYTFLCGQEFRRDEYSWHYKNVHNDIHGGLNGWLEHRCPLAHYGCMYSLRRFYPTVKGATVIHNDTLESFGVKPFVPYDIPVLNHCSKVTQSISQSTSHNKLNSFSGLHVQNTEDSRDWSVISSQPLALCQLPFEVLRYICRFLDSFSLCNLALTCRRLREVCCSLLEERGLVVQQWKKRHIGSRVTWSIAYKYLEVLLKLFVESPCTTTHHIAVNVFKCLIQNDILPCIYSRLLMKCNVVQIRYVESKPLFHMFGEEPDPSLHAKLMASCEENQEISIRRN